MSVNKPVVDRVPTYPGRVRMLPVSGQANTYDMVRADSPVVEGTPINKALLDQKAYTLTKDVALYVAASGNDTTGNGTSSAPYKTINKALSTIPKTLGGFTATIYISAGAYNEVVNVEHFSNGRVLLSAASSGTAITVTGLYFLNTQYAQISSTINLTVGNSGIFADNNSAVISTGTITVNGGEYGIRAENGTNFTNSGTVTINNTTIAAVRASNGALRLNTVAGTGNDVAFLSMNAGKVAFTNDSGISAVTKYQTSGGGRILSGSQASIPSY